MIIKLIILILLTLVAAAFIMYLTEPTNEFHAKVKWYMTVKIYEFQKMIDPDYEPKIIMEPSAPAQNASGTELPTAVNVECDEKFGADFDYLDMANSGSYGGESPEVAYTNGFQSACKAAAQYRKSWTSAQAISPSTLSAEEKVYVDLVQGKCTTAEFTRVLTDYAETENIEEYIKGAKDGCKSMTGKEY
tara:strand:- start:73 stop:642 length:570 start_codon:yes stop_codon:yes gene_type:complete